MARQRGFRALLLGALVNTRRLSQGTKMILVTHDLRPHRQPVVQLLLLGVLVDRAGDARMHVQRVGIVAQRVRQQREWLRRGRVL